MLRRWDLRRAARAARIVAFGVLCFGGVAGAATNAFTFVGPEGGPVHNVALHPTMPWIAYAFTPSGYYRSTDSGLTWRQLAADLINPPIDVAFDPTDPNRVLFAVPGDSPVLSTDAGATLARVSNFPFIPFGVNQVEYSADGSTAYATATVRVFRSTDGGRTWTERTPVTANANSALSLLRVDPLNPDVVYLQELHEGGFRSTDGGGTWQPLPLPERTVDLAIAATTPRRIWAASALTGIHVSTDGGATWPPATLQFSGGVLALDPQDPSVGYAAVYPHGLFRTRDGGNSWANVHGNARVGPIRSIAVNRQEPAKLLLGGELGVAAGVPAAQIGGSWETRNHGILATIGDRLAAARGSSRVYFNAFSGGLYFLADGAALMMPVNEEAIDPQLPGLIPTVSALLVQSRGADRLYVGINAGYARSDDGGDSWHASTTGGVASVFHFADAPGNPQLILASTVPGLQRSIDGGDTWMPATAGLPAGAYATAMVVAATSANTVYAGIGAYTTAAPCCLQQGVYKSSDGGASWTAANAGFTESHIRGLAVDPANAQLVYAATLADGLLKSTNGGASWSRVTWPGGPSAFAVAIDPDVPNIVYVAAGSHAARSVDAGATWQELPAAEDRPRWDINALLADPRRPGTLLMSTLGRGVAEITIAPNLVLESGAVPFTPTEPSGRQRYEYRLRNVGPFHATGVRAVVTLPAGTTGISAAVTNGSCSVQATTVTCQRPVLEAAATADLVVGTDRPAVGTVEVLASVRGDQPDPQMTDNEVRYSFTVLQAVTPAPPGNGSGGGGTSSWIWLLALAALGIGRSYASPSRFRISGVGPSNAAIATLPTYFRSRIPTGVV